jgi:hypothetical protein
MHRSTPFDHFHVGLLQVHRELRQQTSAILAGVAKDAGGQAAVGQMIAGFCENLENHHRSEDVFFFPAFRSAGRLRSTDIAFLDARDDEHVALVRLAGELQQLSGRSRNRGLVPTAWWGTVHRLVTEVTEIAGPHFAAEESVLTAKHVADMISERELGEVYRDMGQNWNRRR